MKDRLNQLLKHEGLTGLKFAELMEVQPSSISHLLSGRNKPSFDFMEKILLRFPDVDPDWLILGKGNMKRNNISTESQKDLFTDIPQSEQLLDFSSTKIEMINSLQDTNKDIFTKNNTWDGEILTDLRTDHQLSENNRGSDSKRVDQQQEIVKKVERVVFFYTDHSFSEYKPE